jgi:hypothetical protein
MQLTELQFVILRCLADDYEDVEQLYLYANDDPAQGEAGRPSLPPNAKIRFPLRDVLDEIAEMLREGYIEPKYSNDQEVARVDKVNFATLHH